MIPISPFRLRIFYDSVKFVLFLDVLTFKLVSNDLHLHVCLTHLAATRCFSRPTSLLA